MKHIFCLIFFGIIFFQTFSQGFFLGLNPPSLKWKQIHTDKVQIIFPQTLLPKAQRVANLVHFLYDSSRYSIGEQAGKVSIILHDQNIIPNGFVSLSPFRSEFYTTPPQFTFGGPIDWIDLLAVHEYRHVQQFLNARKGITKLAYYFFRQGGWGAMAAIALPRWYFEGDATLEETVSTYGGRGRMPSFVKQYRALLLSGKNYNYEKASAGSIKDFVPNHYHLGYYMVTHARREFGNIIWKKTIEDAVRYKGIFYPLSHSLHKNTGLYTKQLYFSTIKKLREKWSREAQKLNLTSSVKINRVKKKHFTSYTNPVIINDSLFIVEKTSFDQIKTYYYINSLGSEKFIAHPGNFSSLNATLSYKKNRLVWAEYNFDPRWANRVYSEIVIYNLSTRKRKKITYRSKYFAPTFSPDGKHIITVEIPNPSTYRLVIIDSHTGKFIRTLLISDTDVFSFPKWTDDGKYIIAVAQNTHGNALIKITVDSGEKEYLIDYNYYQISNPFPRGKYVYFQSSMSGIDNIYALDIETKTIFQISSTLFGAYQPYVSQDEHYLLMSEFSVKGYNLKKLFLQSENWKKINEKHIQFPSFYQPLIKKGEKNVLANVSKKEYPVTTFNTKSYPFNFHTIRPYFQAPSYSLTLFTKNKFSTLSGLMKVNYNRNENNFTYNASVWYGEYYPVFKTNFSYGNSRTNYEFIVSNGYLSFFKTNWQEKKIQLGIGLPFNFSKSTYTRNLNIDFSYDLINVDYGNNFLSKIRNGNFSAFTFNLSFSNFRARALKHINPRWGQRFRIRYQTTLETQNNKGNQLQLNTTLFFPGLFRSHSFYLTASSSFKNLTNKYTFPDIFIYPRGYRASINDQIQRLSFNYSFPLLYPDLALGPFSFIKRIRLNLFYDHALSIIRSPDIKNILRIDDIPINSDYTEKVSERRSIGSEILFDFRAFRLIDLSMGIRYSRLLDADDINLNPNDWETIIIGLNF